MCTRKRAKSPTSLKDRIYILSQSINIFHWSNKMNNKTVISNRIRITSKIHLSLRSNICLSFVNNDSAIISCIWWKLWVYKYHQCNFIVTVRYVKMWHDDISKKKDNFRFYITGIQIILFFVIISLFCMNEAKFIGIVIKVSLIQFIFIFSIV